MTYRKSRVCGVAAAPSGSAVEGGTGRSSQDAERRAEAIRRAFWRMAADRSNAGITAILPDGETMYIPSREEPKWRK